jgi:hypothetical protein
LYPSSVFILVKFVLAWYWISGCAIVNLDQCVVPDHWLYFSGLWSMLYNWQWWNVSQLRTVCGTTEVVYSCGCWAVRGVRAVAVL